MTQDEIIEMAVQAGVAKAVAEVNIDIMEDFANLVAAKEREACQWGVDWGKAGDIPCVSIIKRLPDGGIKVLAVEYAPYSYTTSPKPEQDDGMCTACENNLCTAKQGCVALDNPPQRTWVGLTDEEIEKCYETTGYYQTLRPQDRFAVFALSRAIEAKLKQKNGFAEENT